MDYPHRPASGESDNERYQTDRLKSDDLGPGIRFLEGAGEFRCPHCDRSIHLEALSLKLEGQPEGHRVRLDLRHPEEPLEDVLDQVRRVLVTRALRAANGVKARAAEIAGMKYTTFYELCRRLEISDAEISGAPARASTE